MFRLTFLHLIFIPDFIVAALREDTTDFYPSAAPLLEDAARREMNCLAAEEK